MASEEDVLLREVDDDLARDQTFERLRKYRVPAGIGAALVLTLVAGYQIITGQRDAAATEAAKAYADLSFTATDVVTPEVLTGFAGAETGGFGVLASLRAAAQLAERGERAAALDLYAAIYDDKALSAPMRDFARLRAAYVAFDSDASLAASLASGVETEAFRPHAEEISAGAALAQGQYAAAKAGFEALAMSLPDQSGLKTRAHSFAALADAAVRGSVLEPSDAAADAESFINQFGADLQDAGIPVGPPAGQDVLPEPPIAALPDSPVADDGDDLANTSSPAASDTAQDSEQEPQAEGSSQ
ncbi:MAG: hypothetical protein AAF788_06055 [Pseudomonadota bacterium]